MKSKINESSFPICQVNCSRIPTKIDSLYKEICTKILNINNKLIRLDSLPTESSMPPATPPPSQKKQA